MTPSRSALSRTLTALLLGALVLNLAPLAVPPGRVAAAAGAPLLVLVDSATDPLSTYVQEILNAEGVKDYEVRPLGDLTSGALLSGRRAVLLGEATPTGAQISALDTFVSAGGGLVAMRPAAGLNAILGVTRQGATTAEGYLQITDPTYGAGLSGDTLQFHGAASQYTLAGAAQVAALYSSRTAPTGLPAVTLATHGAGQAALFSFDLGRSVALTRQGNPASANVDVDGDGIVRTIDLYKNWADLERTSVPQANLQQRLLVRLLQTVMAQPLPRLWYFPNAAPTVLVATGDAHANPDAYYQAEIDALRQIGATATFYLSPAGNPAAATLAGWQALGFDFAPHPYVDCSGGCSGGCSGAFDCGYDSAFAWFEGTYGFAPRTVRTHQVRAAGWTDAAAVQAQHGVGMSFDTYQWGQWLTTASGAPALGYLDGSGQPMRYIDAGGTLLPLYQQHTVLVDEELAPQAGLRGLSLADAVAAARQVIDASVDGYYTPITTQFHVDYFYPDNSTWALQTAQYALQRGAPSLTAAAWLSFVQQRAATTVTTSAWAANTLSFTVGSGGAGQTLLVPLQYGTTALATLKVNGAAASYAPMVVNGTAFAAVSVQSGTYVATYAPDTSAPTITGKAPAANATNVPSSTPVSVTFSEVMNRTTAQAAFSLAPSAAGAFSWDSAGTTMTFTPSAALAGGTTYTAAVSNAATDPAGNALANPTSWSFTTAAVTPPPAVAGVSPISGPITGSTTVTLSGTGFTGATAVSFGGTAAASFSVTADTTIAATAPAHAAGTVDIVVTTAVGTSAIVPADRYTFVDQSATLAATAVDPATGAVAGGSTVTITGANFATGATVTFGGTAATNVSVTSTTAITATAPAHAAGAVAVVVTNPNGQNATLASGYAYVTCPTACLTQTTAADFAAGTAGAGTTVTQAADGEVRLAPAVGAEFSGSALPSGWSAAPWGTGGGATVGNGVIAVDGALVATTAYYGVGRSVEYVATFSGSTPFQHAGLGTDLNNSPWVIFSTGSAGGALYARTNTGSSQTDTLLTGNWLGAPHRFRIDWSSTSVIFSIDGTQVAAHTAAVTSDLRPVISDGAPGSGNLAVDWLRMSPYAAAGSFTSRALDAGGAADWGTIAWSGSAPAGTSLVLNVRMGNTPVPDGTWTAFAPVTNGGTVGGNARYLQYRADLATTAASDTPALRDLTVGYTVTGPLSPTVLGVAPGTGSTAGGTVVTITGATFASGAAVTFGGVAATGVSVASSTSLTATAPAHAPGVVDVVVTNPDGGSGILPGGFTYLAPPPTVTGVSPASGPTTGGTTVTISGTNFTGVTAVAFGSVAATSFTVNSDTAIAALAPAQAAGPVSVTVTTLAGTSPAGGAATFTYADLPPGPQVQLVTPGTGTAAGGTHVTITGVNFTGATAVTFDGTAASFAVVSATTLTATAPAHTAGVVDVMVTTPSGPSSAGPAARFAYVACPTGCVTQTTAADFAAGTPDAGISPAQSADGELTLTPKTGTEFGGAALPAGWTSTPWGDGGGATVGGGRLTVDGALVATDAYYTPGRSLEFVATFDATAPAQHIGFGTDLNGAPWAVFSTGGSGGALYARSNSGGSGSSQIDTLLPGNWLGAPHRFRIDWTTSGITYSIDGTPVASHPIGNTGDLRPVISDGPVGGGSLALDWLRLSPYAAAGTFTSGVLDAGDTVTWNTLAWAADVPTGATLALSVHTSADGANWTAFAPVTSGGTVGSTARYVQYRAEFTTADDTVTPTLRDVTIAYTAAAAPVVTAQPAVQAVLSGATVTFTAAASGAPTPTVQWQVSTDSGAHWAALGGATGTTLTFIASAAQDSTQYRAVFTNAAGTATTAAATLTVTLPNQAPSFTAGPNQAVATNAGPQTVPSWATHIAAGPANESGQSLTFLVTSNTNAALFSAGPAIDPVGTLTFTPAHDAGGTATLTVALGDDGGTANGGQDTSAPQTFTITVTPGAPTVTAQPSSQTVLAGQPATFTAATGNPAPTVQWQVSTNGGQTWADLGGATGTTLTFTASAAQDNNQYRAVFTNAAGTAATAAATLIVTPTTPIFTLAVTSSAGGQASPAGTTPAPAGAAVQLTATPAAGYLFTGWTIDGQFAGFRTPLTLSLTRDRTARAAFAPRPTLPDVPATTPSAAAIARLNALGVLRGYGDGRIGPNDVSLRAQMAALIARAMGWDQVSCGNPFPDRGQVDNNLWRNVGALNCKHVAQGFPDGTFRPTGPVLQVQVLSFITRAMVAQGYWRQAATDDPRIYPNVPVASGHRLDLVTFVHYAGAMPDQPANQDWAGWDTPASRGWFAQVLDNALSSQFEGVATP